MTPNALKTWVTARTLELRGEYSGAGITQRLKAAFASGRAVRHEDRYWTVVAWDVESGERRIWRAVLQETAKPERQKARRIAEVEG